MAYTGPSQLGGVGGAAPFTAGVATVPSTVVEIRIACRNLVNKDAVSKSDPMCVILIKEFASDKYVEIGRTEVIKDTLNPDFVKSITMNYNFEESQKLKFEIYDSDSSSQQLYRHDFLGQMECTLGEIVANRGVPLQRPLKHDITSRPGGCGNILVSAEELSSCKEILTLQLCAAHLDKKDFMGKSDPFLVIAKCNEDNSNTVVHKTEVVKNDLSPTWRPFSIPVRVLCNGDLDRSLSIECYDWDSDGSHDLIGLFKTNARTLMKGPTEQNIYECINHKKKAKKSSYKNSGIVRVMSCKVDIEYTFLDYIKSGTELHFTVAVDFTGSNGDPRNPTSLHYVDPSRPNSYALAIRAVGDIVQDYDSDKMFPALGFGAKVPPTGLVSHEFFLNGSPDNPYCPGVDGILQAYYRTLGVVQLYGPTNFSPVINHVSRFAATIRDGSAYFVLLIITDGIITDMVETKDAIVAASALPLSIIIVGVGDADFGAMEELDGDLVRITNRLGRSTERDIVQFVPLRNFMGSGSVNMPWQQSQARLGKEVLAEIPNQVVAYMKKFNIIPRAVTVPPPNAAAAPPTNFPIIH